MRPLLAFAAFATFLAALLGLRLWWQNVELSGPPGGAGVVEGTSILVSSRLSARIATVDVAEGQEVTAGTRLLTLDCSDAEASLADAQARLDMSQAQADAAAAQAAATQRSGAASLAASKAAAAQAQALAAQRDGAERSARRLETLGDDVTVERRDQARTQAQGFGEQVAGAEASQAASAHQAAAAQEQGRAASAQALAATDAVKSAQAALAKATLLVGECTVTAPSGGYVETLPWHVGELVQPGATLARLVDISEVKATFYLPNAEVAAVKAGAEADVEADAYPGATFKGRVSTVSLNAEFTPRNIQTRSDRDRLVYPVQVRVPNADGRLRPGMPVQVTLPDARR